MLHTIHGSIALSIGLISAVFVTSFSSPVEDNLISKGILTIHTFPFFASAQNIGCIFASIATGFVTEYLGIKTAMLVASIPGMLGAFLIALGHDGLSMIAGRFLTGIYLSFCLAELPVFFVEIAEPSNMKLFGAIVPLMFRFSLLLLYTLGIWMQYTWLAIILLAMIAFMCLNLLFLPESPNWLKRKRMLTRAEDAMRYYYNPPETETETETDTDTQEVVEDPPQNLSFFNWIIIRPMLVSLTIQMAVSCTTHEFLLDYSTHTFDRAVNINPHVAVLFYPISLIVGTSLFMWLIHKIHWKKLLMITTCLQILVDTIMGITLYLSIETYDCIDRTEKGLICEVLLIAPMVLIFLIGLFFSMGAGSICWWSYGNIVHPHYATVSTGLITLIDVCFSLLNDLLSPLIALTFGNYVVFLAYALVLVLMLIVQIFY